MTAVYVSFIDSAEVAINAVFRCAQDATEYPNQGQIDDADARYLAFIKPSSTLAGAKSNQLTTLAEDFASASGASVTDNNGVIWSGGMSSAVSIYGAVQLASAGGATSVTLFDASNLPHVVTIAEGTAVAAIIGAAYQTVFAKYQGYKVAIAAATTIAAVQEIVWEE
jgi:hypothetical protein